MIKNGKWLYSRCWYQWASQGWVRGIESPPSPRLSAALHSSPSPPSPRLSTQYACFWHLTKVTVYTHDMHVHVYNQKLKYSDATNAMKLNERWVWTLTCQLYTGRQYDRFRWRVMHQSSGGLHDSTRSVNTATWRDSVCESHTLYYSGVSLLEYYMSAA